jgi:hypothetical protein
MRSRSWSLAGPASSGWFGTHPAARGRSAHLRAGSSGVLNQPCGHRQPRQRRDGAVRGADVAGDLFNVGRKRLIRCVGVGPLGDRGLRALDARGCDGLPHHGWAHQQVRVGKHAGDAIEAPQRRLGFADHGRRLSGEIDPARQRGWEERVIAVAARYSPHLAECVASVAVPIHGDMDHAHLKDVAESRYGQARTVKVARGSSVVSSGGSHASVAPDCPAADVTRTHPVPHRVAPATG